jgi:acyl carrier protein
MNSIETQVIQIVSGAAMVEPSRIRPETSLAEMGVDSLAQIECVFSLEEAFQIEIGEEELWKLRTVRDVIDAVNHALGTKRSITNLAPQ